MPRSGSSLSPSSWRRRASSGARRRTRRPPGRTPSVAMPLRDALLHDAPDLEQVGADLLLGAPRQLVLEHDAGDRLAGLLAVGEQLVAGAERVRDRGRVLHDHRRAVDVLADDEAAADGVVRVLGERPAVGVESRERHAVRVHRKGLAPVQGEVLVLVEVDLVLAEQREPLRRADLGEASLDLARVAQLGPLTREAEQDGLVAPVPVTRGAERAEQLRAHPRDPVEDALVVQPLREARRGPHRPDGV